MDTGSSGKRRGPRMDGDHLGRRFKAVSVSLPSLSPLNFFLFPTSPFRFLNNSGLRAEPGRRLRLASRHYGASGQRMGLGGGRSSQGWAAPLGRGGGLLSTPRTWDEVPRHRGRPPRESLPAGLCPAPRSPGVCPLITQAPEDSLSLLRLTCDLQHM